MNVLIVAILIVLLAACGNQSEKAAETDPTLRDSVVFTMVATDSISVFDLLQQNHAIEFKESAIGNFVTSIDSLTNSSSAYWVYSVNSEMIPKAADHYRIGSGDTLRWHLRKPSGK